MLFARTAAPTLHHARPARAPRSSQRLVATGKVFSPQFLLWLIVLVPLVRGLAGRIGATACLLAMLLTTSWFPFRYLASVARRGLQTTLLLVRNGIVLALLVLLIRGLGRATGAV